MYERVLGSVNMRNSPLKDKALAAFDANLETLELDV